jgi:hypothetical protein
VADGYYPFDRKFRGYCPVEFTQAELKIKLTLLSDPAVLPQAGPREGKVTKINPTVTRGDLGRTAISPT